VPEDFVKWREGLGRVLWSDEALDEGFIKL
jgi:hypothetical protein